ncbi:MAG: class I SAM-dependent methyltransferase [Candidatus Omnitrophica bacterium]|nr:class I SAM-dependent methyltransferase [Candidatus Omnitrophota bacterium]
MKIIGEINRILKNKFGFEIHIVKDLVVPKKDYLWIERKQFKNIYNTYANYTLVDEERCYQIYQFLHHSFSLQGDMAEIGVYRGGTAGLIAETSSRESKKVYLFDTFCGLPVANSVKDTHWKGGEFSDTCYEDIKKLLSKFGHIEIYKGFFPETAEPVKNKSFCFIHVDVDIYQSALDCCNFFYDRLTKGGIIIFDDYGFIGSEGLKSAVDEFFSSKPEKPIYLSTGQGLIIKV